MPIRKLFWFAFISTIFIYNLIIFIAVKNAPSADRIVRELSFNDPVVLTIGILTIIAAIGSIMLSRIPITSAPKDFAPFIIRLAISDLPLIFGIMISYATLNQNPILIASVISILLFILNRPETESTI